MSLKNGLISSILSILTVGLLSQTAYSANLAKLNHDVLNQSVQIDIPGGGKCSGTVVYSDRDKISGDVTTYILTAKHCTKDNASRNFNVWFPQMDKDNRKTGVISEIATVEGQSYKSDLSMLKLKNKDKIYDAAQVALTGSPGIGDSVLVAGYSLGMDRFVTEGLFGSRTSFNFPDADRETEYFQSSPAIAPGNSGGGLFIETEAGYKLIGVADAVAKGYPNIGWYVPTDQIADFLSFVDGKVWPKEKETGKKND